MDVGRVAGWVTMGAAALAVGIIVHEPSGFLAELVGLWAIDGQDAGFPVGEA